MFYLIISALITLWLVALATSFTMGGYINILLAVAVMMVFLNAIRGKAAM